MAPSRHHRDHRRSRSRSRSRSHSSHRHTYNDDDRRSSKRREYHKERENSRIIKDEFGREVRESDLRRIEKEMEERRQKTSTESKDSKPVNDHSTPSKTEEYEIEEGEDVSANMREIMGFGSFSSTKGKHVKDNDSLVNRGAVRKVKQFKAMRILNRKVPSEIRKRSRNDPTVIKVRIGILTCFTVCVILFHQWLLQYPIKTVLEWWGFANGRGFLAVLFSILHLLLLFTGHFVEVYYDSRENHCSFSSLLNHYQYKESIYFLRDCVISPLLEEVLYRGSILVFLFKSNYSLKQAIWISSLAFGSCHIHRIIDLMANGLSFKKASLSCCFMATYTTLFGVLVSYVYVRTGSLMAAITIHGMCNFLSIPSFSFWNSSKRYFILTSYIVGIVLYIGLFTVLLNPIFLKSHFQSFL